MVCRAWGDVPAKAGRVWFSKRVAPSPPVGGCGPPVPPFESLRTGFDFPQGERPPRPRMTLALGSCLRSNDACGAGRRGLMAVEGPLRQAQGERIWEARVRWGGGVGDGG